MTFVCFYYVHQQQTSLWFACAQRAEEEPADVTGAQSGGGSPPTHTLLKNINLSVNSPTQVTTVKDALYSAHD